MLDAKIEKKIKNKALELLSFGRTNWDIRHTLCAVNWIKKLIEKEGGDERTLVPAAYLHDTGYEELRLGYNHDECLAAKLNHAERGAKNAADFLPCLNYFTPEEIEKIVYLIKNHDQHDNINELDRQLLFEADGLAQIDWENCYPSYDKENCTKFLNTTFKNDRLPYVKTKTGIKKTKELLQKAYKYLEKMS